MMFRLHVFLCLLFNLSFLGLYAQVEYKYHPVPTKYSNRFFQKSVQLAIDKEGFEIENILPKGYKRDGSVDYTDYIQAAINKYKVLKFPNFPLKVNVKGLNIWSNRTLIFREGSSLIMEPNGNTNYAILRLHAVSNVKIYNLKIIGDREKHFNNSGQWGMGISIRGSKNILIDKAIIEKCWGDAIYLGSILGGKSNEDIKITNSMLDYNRRNGISIISGINILIKNCIISNTVGHNPMAGIDIEPNNSNDVIRNIELLDIVTFNNRWYGIIVSLSNLQRKNSNKVSVNIINHTDECSTVALATTLGTRKKNELNSAEGKINIYNPTWIDNSKTSFLYNETYYDKIIVEFKNVRILQSQFNKNTQNQYLFDQTIKRTPNLRID
ncbi:hypothetical protein GCM10023173_11860 [Sphingobacterium thermophilum]|uniref:Right handed beta helix domain-containing protein n=1 Tax=Sphingobacterium thermophilum TaxID=768534 RepID=A0ABP8R0F8_9SPHI